MSKKKRKPKKPGLSPNIANMHRGTVLTDNLFRSLNKKEERKPFRASQMIGGSLLRFSGPEELGVAEMSVLCVLVARAATAKTALTELSKGNVANQLRLKLKHDGKSWDLTIDGKLRVPKLTTSLRQIGLAAGYAPSSNNRQYVLEAIRRLSEVSFAIETSEYEEGPFHLISYHLDKSKDEITAIPNPIFAEAMISAGLYSAIPLTGNKGLRSDSSKLLHWRLCGLIDPGKGRYLSYEKLVEYIWPVKNEKAHRMRKSRVKTAALALTKLDWKVEDRGEGARLERPKLTY